jgi:hypothetical protein
MIHYRIYQAEPDSDCLFKDLDEIGALRPCDYVMVYENEFISDSANEQTDISVLCKLFEVFNANHPEDYLARSISPSDVIELYSGENDEACERYYYVNKIGYVKVEFDGKKAEWPAKSEYEIMTVPENETDLLYSKETEKEEYCSIGYLRGDFSQSGNLLQTDFFDHCTIYKNVQFRIQFQSVVNYLINIGMLISFNAMEAYFNARPEYKLGPKHRENEYGFKIETERFRYYFRAILRKGDYNIYCFTYAQKNHNSIKEA